MNVLCFPGTVHDQFIFSTSIIHTKMNRLHTQKIGKYFLLGKKLKTINISALVIFKSIILKNNF